MDGAFDNERDNEQRGAATGNRHGGFRRLDEPGLVSENHFKTETRRMNTTLARISILLMPSS